MCYRNTLKGCGANGAEDKHRLISTLWDHLVAMESPLWKRCRSSNGAAFPIQVGPRPAWQAPSPVGRISGSCHLLQRGWRKSLAALCGDESDIGIDVAGTHEFQREYPFHGSSMAQELQHALRYGGRRFGKGISPALVYQEAVVKALGMCIPPRGSAGQITVYPSTGGDGGYTFPVGLSGKALVRFPIAAGRSLWVRSLPQRRMWLSIALLNRRPTGHE